MSDHEVWPDSVIMTRCIYSHVKHCAAFGTVTENRLHWWEFLKSKMCPNKLGTQKNSGVSVQFRRFSSHCRFRQLYIQTLTFMAPCIVRIFQYISKNMQRYTNILPGNCSTCFGWYLHPSSEAQTTVSAASGICHTGVTNTRCCRYSCLRFWWWVEVPLETCRAVSR